LLIKTFHIDDVLHCSLVRCTIILGMASVIQRCPFQFLEEVGEGAT